MERPSICKPNKNYISAKPKIADPFCKDNYTSLKSYDTPICGDFTHRTFLNDVEPSMSITTDKMCKTNNDCTDNSVYKFLNKRGVQNSPYFEKDSSGEMMSMKADSRLYDARHSYFMQLDSTPVQVVYDLINDNVAGNPELAGYGKNYKGYSTVTGGQIQYYIDKELAEPFYSPVYGTKAKANGSTYRDPMDSVKPHYDREYPAYGEFPTQTYLSFVDDTTKFRDDLISRQQRVHNQQKFELIYGRE
jgi:hypothetical protein